MKHLYILLLLFIIVIHEINSQNKQVLYGFDEIPQILLLNPGATVNYKYHVGIPFLSGVSFQAGVTGDVTIADVFRNDMINFNVKYRNALNKLSVNDYIQLNTQIEILNAGYKLNDKYYISGGFYTEVDAFMAVPKNILQLINDGNASNLNKDFLASEVSVKSEVLSVLHVGISKKVDDKLTVGGRLKIYSGIANVTSTENKGSFTTKLGQDNIYTHHLNNIDAAVYSSGIYNENNNVEISTKDIISRSLLGGNLGLGIDFGITYKINKQTELTASLLDVGFVNYSKGNRNASVKGSYDFSGIEFKYDGTNRNYWEDLKNDIESQIPNEEDKNSYTVMRPIKFNSSVKHSWGKSRREETCYDMTYNKFYNNAIGGQLFAVFRPTGPKFAFTSFYERILIKGVRSKITYTVDDFSYTNFGLGLSVKTGKLNIYGVVDNLFKIADIADANIISFQLGVNLIFK
ncbi:hypothetical protein KUL113_47270 [Tenacibaculum sp. KUL113]|nr:hypothetical protein KUL113_47270 [Tenacibaculum sp. KUL113]